MPYVSAATAQMFLQVNELQEGLARPFVRLFRSHAYLMRLDLICKTTDSE
jgi:hypothetical protein